MLILKPVPIEASFRYVFKVLCIEYDLIQNSAINIGHIYICNTSELYIVINRVNIQL